MPDLLDLPAMARWLGERHTRDLFRFEALPFYDAASDGGDYDRFLRGEQPQVDKAAWLAKLAGDTAARRRWRRVRVFTDTPYFDYSANCGYPDNVAAGEDVRVFDRPDAQLGELVGDFFVVDGHVLLTHYDDHGRHVGGEVVEGRDAGAYIAVRDLVWSQAVPFTEWWAAHPERHRSLVRAA